MVLTGISCSTKTNDNPIPPINKPGFTKASDIVWASPKGFNLTMDIYTPATGKPSYPVIVIFHGGGWLINNKSIMSEMSEYMVNHSEYVVCNVNYRLLGNLGNNVMMNEIVEDAFGAVLWIKENIGTYQGDAAKIIVTGDSSGGHLATMVATQHNTLEADGFGGTTLGFMPTYLPKGKTVEQVAQANELSVQAAIISYGVFDIYESALNGLEKAGNYFWSAANAQPRGIFGNGINVNSHSAYYMMVSPFYHIPQATVKKLPPMLFTVGSKDNLTTPASIQKYTRSLKDAGHNNIEYWVHEGRPHAFLDSGTNTSLGISFQKDAPPALDKMIAFLNKIFY